MPQDQPATVAGTDSKTCKAHPHRDATWCSNLGQSHQCGERKGHRTPHKCVVCGGVWESDDTPDTWAPVNRRAMRDDVDRFRNLRMPIPRTLEEARELAALALEYYEHAHEVSTRTANTVAELEAESLTGAQIFDPENPAGEHYRRTLAKKGEADKELAVADRRHATALAYLNTFKGE